jgi:ABA DEFICIENT 4-like
MYILLFNLAGPAIVGWALMIFLPAWPVTRWIAARAVFPAYLAVLYVIGVVPLVIAAGPRIMLDFGSADGVLRLLANPGVALIAWIHILAFDQVAGLLIYRHNMRHRTVSLAAQSVILFLTLMFGPAGFLAYYLACAARNSESLFGKGASA